MIQGTVGGSHPSGCRRIQVHHDPPHSTSGAAARYRCSLREKRDDSMKPGVTPDQQDLEDMTIALVLSDVSSVVVGSSGYQPPTGAFIRTPETKIVKLRD